MIYNRHTKRNRGFTMIELLVVISIIGILSTIVLSSIKVSRDKAANQYTVSTVLEYQKALELIYQRDGGYPFAGTGPYTCLTGVINDICTIWFTDNFVTPDGISAEAGKYTCLGYAPPGQDRCKATFPYYRPSRNVTDLLREFVASLPNPNQKLVSSDFGDVAATYSCFAYNVVTNKCVRYSINYFLEGSDSKCHQSPIGGPTSRSPGLTHNSVSCVYTSP